MHNIHDLLEGVSTLAVVCTQWGDTGKGKIVDLLAGEWADIVARGTGGANAGHTIQADGRTHVFHLIPSGILHDGAGKVNVIGSGVAFDPKVFCEELAVLRAAELSYDHLMVALNARLVLPQHILLDRLRESSAKEGRIGTTGRGIGPVYVDHYARVGLVVNDLLNPDCLARKLRRNIEEKRPILEHAGRELVRSILEHEHVGGGRFWHPRHLLDLDAIMEAYRQYGAQIADMVRDADAMLLGSLRTRNVLLEGTQGNLLSIDRGTYPFVTSSDCSMQGLARGVGLMDRHIDRTLGIVKFPYMTRVGAGPFPTEMGGKGSDEWCNDAHTTEALELERYPNASVNSMDPFEQGIGVRQAGGEYGSTTRRPRRVGWLDVPLLRYSRRYTGRDVILTKPDVLDECRTIKVCTAYRYEGPPHHIGGNTVLHHGGVLKCAVPDYDVLRHCVPEYVEFDGWRTPISEARTAADLPARLLHIIRYVACESDLHVVMLSVGPDREQIVAMDE